MSANLILEIGARRSFADGKLFGSSGAYELLSGRVRYSVDPTVPAYRSVVDLERAAREADGRVSFTAEFCLLKPVDFARGNRRILFDVINRGNKRAVQFFNDAPHSNEPSSAAHAGNGFLMRQGYTVAWLAWQGDVLPGGGRMTMQLPIAGSAAEPVTGALRAEFIVDREGVSCLPLSGNAVTHSYPAFSLDTKAARFTRREYADSPREIIAADAWQFARVDESGAPLASAQHCYLPGGFRPGWIHELVYTARDPRVLGLGFPAVRDFLAFLRRAERDAAGTPNPLRVSGARVERVYGWGRSLSGRYLREFVYRGWNEDACGERVFDGVFAHVAGAGRVALNYRFAQPGRFPRQHEDHVYPSDQFPFAYGLTTDPWSARGDAILKRPATDPLVIHSQTAAEYWQRRGSLVHTDAFGADLPEHPQARVFLFASAQHFAAPRGRPLFGPHRNPSNPLDTAPILRALLVALDRWATAGTSPPGSRVPRRMDGTLATAHDARARFPAIASAVYPATPNRLFLLDYGEELNAGRFTLEPPREDRDREYAVLVPMVDADGNEVAGVRAPQLAVPVATYTGWNWRREGARPRALASVVGSFLPFACDAAERARSGDPRPSIAERYRSHHDYIAKIAVAAHALVAAGLLLEEDVERCVERAISAGWPPDTSAVVGGAGDTP